MLLGGPGAASRSPQSTGELVSELSQVEYQLRAWSGIDTPGWELRAGVDLELLRVRKEELRTELRARGLDFPEVDSQEPPRPPGGHSRAEPGPNAPDHHFGSAALLLAQVGHLERALLTRTVIGQANSILMERHNITAKAAFAMLRQVSSVTNRKLCVLAAELVETRVLPGSSRGEAASTARADPGAQLSSPSSSVVE